MRMQDSPSAACSDNYKEYKNGIMRNIGTKRIPLLVFLAFTLESIVTIYDDPTAFYWRFCPQSRPIIYSIFSLSAILIPFGSRLPSIITASLYSLMSLLSIILTVLKMSTHFFDIGSGICELINLWGFLCVIMDSLSPEAKIVIPKWKYFSLALILFPSLIAFMVDIPKSLEYTQLFQLLPLGGLSITMAVLIGSKKVYFRDTRDIVIVRTLNVSTIFFSVFGIAAANVHQKMETWEDPSSAYREDPLSFTLWWGEGTVSIICVMTCITAMVMFNILATWEASERRTTDMPSVRCKIPYTRQSVVEKDRLLLFLHGLIIIILTGYFIVHLYIRIHVDRKYRFLNEASAGKVGDKFEIDEIINDFNDIFDRLSYIRGYFDFPILVCDLFFFYFAYALIGSHVLCPENVIIIPVLLMIVLSYTAASSSVMFDGFLLSCNVLAHTGIICSVLNMLSVHRKNELSYWRNRLFLLSQICGQLGFQSIYGMDSLTNFLFFIPLVSIEYGGAFFVLYIMKKRSKYQKSNDSKSMFFSGYILLWCIISLSIDNLMCMYRHAESTEVLSDDVLQFWYLATPSIMFYVSSLIIYNLLSSWNQERLKLIAAH